MDYMKIEDFWGNEVKKQEPEEEEKKEEKKRTGKSKKNFNPPQDPPDTF